MEFKGTLRKAVREFKEQAVAGLVSLGDKHEVGDTTLLNSSAPLAFRRGVQSRAQFFGN